jgi:hypothetical protein
MRLLHLIVCIDSIGSNPHDVMHFTIQLSLLGQVWNITGTDVYVYPVIPVLVSVVGCQNHTYPAKAVGCPTSGMHTGDHSL